MARHRGGPLGAAARDPVFVSIVCCLVVLAHGRSPWSTVPTVGAVPLSHRRFGADGLG
ncbi:hypothetical protein GJR88_03905 [Dietzia sp. DQ12-45-1b]|nr:hypothetical protein GJR88_03905 [Dietzia sp. DQ12-45-1b]